MIPQVGDVYEVTTNRGPFSPYRDRKGETITIIASEKGDIRWNVSWWEPQDDYQFDYYDSISPDAFSWFAHELRLVLLKSEPLWEI